MAAYATVIFFDDKKALGQWFEKMPNRKDELTIWSKNGQGILQHTVWTAFATEGLGANLQHCTQVIPGADEAIRKVLDVPAEWEVSGTRRRGAGSEREREGSVAPASGWSERRTRTCLYLEASDASARPSCPLARLRSTLPRRSSCRSPSASSSSSTDALPARCIRVPLSRRSKIEEQ